jgi:hypothetical protein
MGFLGKLKKLFAVGTTTAPMLEVVVRCDRCGEVVRSQINLHHDLSLRDDDGGRIYFCRKGLVGGGSTRCFQEVIVEYTFDANRRVIDRRIEGGRFVEEGE